MVFNLESQKFHLYACLPFLRLANGASIQIGPVKFWSASKYEANLPASHHGLFQSYLNHICHHPNKEKLSSTEQFAFTCLSIAEEIAPEKREFILVDALYLLYFSSVFHSVYLGESLPPFQACRKMIPASIEFISQRQNWQDLFIKDKEQEESICLSFQDLGICNSLGQVLQAIYLPSKEEDQSFTPLYKRLVRSIRYLIDRFFPRFINLFDRGLNFSEDIFEPEDIIFLTSSFEVLFDIDDRYAAADFKHKLRPLLNLRYSKPVEMFWKWTDSFYETKRQIIKGELFIDPIFRLNPNFEISHVCLGVKLFIYAVYYQLFKSNLIQSIHFNHFTPPDFKYIHPEEVLLFFWTETTLLRKINLILKQAAQKSLKEEFLEDMHLLTYLFVSLYECYDSILLTGKQKAIKFIPTESDELRSYGLSILDLFNEVMKIEQKNSLDKVIHPQFIQTLKKKLKSF